MTRYVLFMLAGLVVSGACSTAGVDVSDRWTLKMDPDFKGNSGSTVECTLKQRGHELAIKCGAGGEMKGEVRGRTITWGFEKTGVPPMVEDRLVVTFTGELDRTGNAIRGTWRLKSGVSDEKGRFQAARLRTS